MTSGRVIDVPELSLVVLIGASGSGKSTILKIITGLLHADAGVVWVNGERVDQLTEQEMMAVR